MFTSLKKQNLYLGAILAYLIIGTLLYIYDSTFADSSFFFASITFLVGSLAFYVYSKQKADEKINAATTVLLEIRNAESKVDTIIDKLDKNNAVDLPSILPVNSWRKCSHLFVKDFDLDDIQLLNTFYSSCEVIEDLVNRQNNFVWITTEERAKTVQRILAEIHDDFQKEYLLDHAAAQKKFDDRKKALGDFYANETLSYAPDKILRGLKFQTQNLKRITSTPCGAKLKELAGLSS
jgi:hypothetical protein